MADSGTRRSRQKNGESADDKLTKARRRAEKDVGALDSPGLAEEPSELRHTAYFLGILGFALALNLVAMLMVSGGR